MYVLKLKENGAPFSSILHDLLLRSKANSIEELHKYLRTTKVIEKYTLQFILQPSEVMDFAHITIAVNHLVIGEIYQQKANIIATVSNYTGA